MSDYIPLSFFTENDNDSSSRQLRDIDRGTRELNELSFKSDNITFCPTIINTNSLIKEFEITNTGIQDLAVSLGELNEPFELLTKEPFKLAAGMSVSIKLRFNPTTAGEFTNQLNIDIGNGITYSIDCSATAVAEGTPIAQEPVFNDLAVDILGAINTEPFNTMSYWASITLESLPEPTDSRKVYVVIYSAGASKDSPVTVLVNGTTTYNVTLPNGDANIPYGYIKANTQTVFEFIDNTFRLVE